MLYSNFAPQIAQQSTQSTFEIAPGNNTAKSDLEMEVENQPSTFSRTVKKKKSKSDQESNSVTQNDLLCLEKLDLKKISVLQRRLKKILHANNLSNSKKELKFSTKNQ